MLTVNLESVLDFRVLSGNQPEGLTVTYGDLCLVFNSVKGDGLDYKFLANDDGTISLSVQGYQGVIDYDESATEDELDLPSLFDELDDEEAEATAPVIVGADEDAEEGDDGAKADEKTDAGLVQAVDALALAPAGVDVVSVAPTGVTVDDAEGFGA